MPNWCNNTLELAHKDPAMLERARVAFNEGALCNEFVPVPDALRITAGRVGDDTDPKQVELEAQTASNIEQYGYGNWYDFCVGEWGTKWDVGGDGQTAELENGQLVMSFDSAWAPPVGFYEKLMDQGFEVRAYYYEPGMCFAGVWDNGDDDFYELGGMDSEAVREQIPEILDEMFCISENMEQWEEENIDIDLDGGVSAVNEQEQENE